jgi:hypothetical protein
MNLRIALTTLRFPIRHQASDPDFNHQASVADPAPVPVQICHPSCRGPSHGRNRTQGQSSHHAYCKRQVEQLSRQVSAASQSNRSVSSEQPLRSGAGKPGRNHPPLGCHKSPKMPVGPVIQRTHSGLRQSAKFCDQNGNILCTRRFARHCFLYEIHPIHHRGYGQSI